MDPHSDGRNGDLAAKCRRQHLYLVFDDWEMGLSIRKLDLSDFDCYTEMELPEPFVRIQASHELSQYAAAFGTTIVAMPLEMDRPMDPNIIGSDSLPIGQVGQPVVFDVSSRGLTFLARPTMDLVKPIYIPVDEKLFVLSSNSFQVLLPPITGTMSPAVHSPSWKGTWHQLDLHPFHDDYVTSYAVHPDGTIFVSAKKFAPSSSATYTFDTSNLQSVWKKQGDWALPFTGPAHYDSNMNSWIGVGGMDPFQYICACKVVSSKDDGVLCPLTKVCKDALFSIEPEEWHIGSNLVSMGSEFCLVECVSLDGMDRSLDPPPLSISCVLRLALFSLKYDENGDLTSDRSCRVRYYLLPEDTVGNTLIHPLAFWL